MTRQVIGLAGFLRVTMKRIVVWFSESMVNATRSERISGLAYRKPAMLTTVVKVMKSAVRIAVLTRPFAVAMGRLLPMAATPDPSIVNPGTAGSIVVLCLFIAVALVIRSGYKRIQNLERKREEDN